MPHALPLLGGLAIGLAAALMLLGLGRIAGVSGLTARTLGLGSTPPWLLAASFVVGLPLGGELVARLHGPVETHFPTSDVRLIGAGLLVGFGTRLGSGCTSGHGICGVSRGAPRSLLATAVFIATGIATVAACRALGVS